MKKLGGNQIQWYQAIQARFIVRNTPSAAHWITFDALDSITWENNSIFMEITIWQAV
jgi:hypothetical protein